MNSSEAGRLELRKVSLSPNGKSAESNDSAIYTTWSPVTPRGDVNALLHYASTDHDKRIGDVSAIEIQFLRLRGTTADQFTAEIFADGTAPLPLSQAAEILGTDRYGFALDASLPADRSMALAIAEGAHAKVIIFKADRVLQAEMFEGTQMSLLVLADPKAILSEDIDTNAIAARDMLFAQASPSLVARDPKICTPLRYESGVLIEDSPGK